MFPHNDTNQLICSENQSTGFRMMVTFTITELTIFEHLEIKHYSGIFLAVNLKILTNLCLMKLLQL